MEDKIKVAGEIAAHTYPLSEKSLCRMAAILEPRKLLKNELCFYRLHGVIDIQ